MTDREQNLRSLVVRGSTEGERRAALVALEKHMSQPERVVVSRGRAPVGTIGFFVGATLAAWAWGWGFFACIFVGLVFRWIAKELL